MHERFHTPLANTGWRWRSAAIAFFFLSLFTATVTGFAGPMTVIMTEPPRWASVVAVDYASTATLSTGALMWASAVCCAVESHLGWRPHRYRIIATVLLGVVDLYAVVTVAIIR